MKTTITRLLESLGLAPAKRLAHATAQAQEAADKAKAVEGRLRADVEGWKRRYEEKSNAAAELKQAAARADAKADAKAERLRAEREHAEAQGEEWKKRAQALTTQVQEFRTRLDSANRATTTAREQLMAMEVKLDLIEAALHVLDARTREAAVSRPTDAPADRGPAAT